MPWKRRWRRATSIPLKPAVPAARARSSPASMPLSTVFWPGERHDSSPSPPDRRHVHLGDAALYRPHRHLGGQEPHHRPVRAFGYRVRLALSAFALGYALFQVPAGMFADRFGPRLALALVVALWSFFTGLTGLAWSFVTLLTFRFLFGVAEAGAFPTVARAFYVWLPASERALAKGINLSGSRLGSAFALPAIAWLFVNLGWRDTFLTLGGFGLVWAAGWYWWFRDTPEEHGSI